MKAFIEIEIFGDDIKQYQKLWSGVMNMMAPGFGDSVFGKAPSSGWVAEIRGLDPKWKFQRVFLKGKKDYSRSNSKGSRGIRLEFILETGHLYEVNRQITNKRKERFFCTVSEEGDIIKLTEEEATIWLKNT